MRLLKIISPLHKARRHIELYLEERLQGYGVTVVEGHLLSYLFVCTPASVGGLCHMTGLKPSTMTSILDRMEERGLIERSPNPEDRRSWLISLSSDGTRLAGEMRRVAEAFEAAVIAEVDELDLAGFRRVIEAIGSVTSVKVSE